MDDDVERFGRRSYAACTHTGFLPESDPAPVVGVFTRTGITAAGSVSNRLRYLTLLRYHGVYVTPVLFDSRFCLNCREYWHRLLRILS